MFKIGFRDTRGKIEREFEARVCRKCTKFLLCILAPKTLTLVMGEKGGDGFICMGFIKLMFNLHFFTLLNRRT